MNKAEIAARLYADGKILAWNGNKNIRVLIHSTWWPLNDRLAAQLLGA